MTTPDEPAASVQPAGEPTPALNAAPAESASAEPQNAPTEPAPTAPTEPAPTAAGDPQAALAEEFGEPVPGPPTAWYHAPVAHPARLMLGLTALAAERLRAGARTGDAFVLTVGLVERAAERTAYLARQVGAPPVRLAGHGTVWATRLPGVRRLRGPANRARERVVRVAAEARDRGRATVALGRLDALGLVRTTVDESLAWAQSQAVPRIVDGLVPHLVADVVPKIIDGVLPEIRERVLPIVIEDLTNEPKLRELIMEQSRTVAGDATEQLRASSASADDRVESAFRRIFPGSHGSSAGG